MGKPKMGNVDAIIEAYNSGESLNSIAKKYNTYATTIKRILERNSIDSGHNSSTKGRLYVKNGEKLIEWAKAQGRLVTKAELAEIVGTKRLSPSYFIKYPELGQYIKTHEINEIQDYSKKLYDWLQKNNILYKPNDRTKLKMGVTALLLGDYTGIVIQIDIKPKCVSKKNFNYATEERFRRVNETGMKMILLKEENFENLDSIKSILEKL